MSAETRYWVLRRGSVAAILGSLLAAAGNVIHPVMPRDDPEGVAPVIADSGAGTLIHVVIVFGIILMLGGLVGIRHSIEGGKAEALARLGVYSATVGVTVGLITVILDGVAAKQLADGWAIAPESGKAIALSVVSANETINFALGGLFNLLFVGVPFILFAGIAVALSGAFPAWLGWTAALAGLGSIGAGYVVSGIHRHTNGHIPPFDHHRANRDLVVAARDGGARRPQGQRHTQSPVSYGENSRAGSPNPKVAPGP